MTDHNSWWLMDNDLFSTVFSGIHKDPKSHFSVCHRTQCDRSSLLPSEKVISFSPRFSCETWDLGRDTFHIVPLFHQGSWTFGEAWRNAREYLCYGQTSHPGAVAKLPVTSCHRNLDKVRLNGHLSECRFYLFHYLQCISGKPDNLWCIEGIESWSNNHACHCDLPGDDLLEQ